MRPLGLTDTIFYNLGDAYITTVAVLDGPCDVAAIIAETEEVVAALPGFSERPLRLGLWSVAVNARPVDLANQIAIVRDPTITSIDGVIALLDTADWPNDQVRDYAGLWNEHPALAGLMTVFLLSLGGFPPMAGFIAKWYVFSAAIKAGYTWLAIIGVLTSVISVFFYLRIVVMMYMTSRESATRIPPVPKIAGAALVVSAILIFYLGILPTRVLDWAAASMSTVF